MLTLKRICTIVLVVIIIIIIIIIILLLLVVVVIVVVVVVLSSYISFVLKILKNVYGIEKLNWLIIVS